MLKVSFKQFSTFVDLPEEASPEQIQEIFGLFKNNEKIDVLKKKRDELKAQQDSKKKELEKKKDEIWAAQRAKLGGQTPAAQKTAPRPSGTPRSAQAAGRAAERDWVDNL